MSLTPAKKQRAEPAVGHLTNRLSEWYLAVCLVGLLTEGVFMAQIQPIVAQGPRAIFGFMILRGFPSEYYFCTIGLAIGLVAVVRSRRTWHVPLMGKGLLLVWVLVFGGGAFYGRLRGNDWWEADLRAALQCMIILPWASVLVQNVNLGVVFKRFMWAAVPLAIVNGLMGIAFVGRLSGASSNGTLWTDGWVGNYILILVFLLAFARSITHDRQGILPMSIVVFGICAGLGKPSLVTLFIGMTIIALLALWLGRTNNSVRLQKMMSSGMVLLFVGSGVAILVCSIDKDSVISFLRRRFLKVDSNADLSTGRLEMWQECLKIWSEQPLLGSGLGLKLRTPGATTKSLAIHNYAVQTLMQTGIIGFTGVAAVVILWLRRALKSLRIEPDPEMLWVRLGLISFMCTMLVAMMYGDVIFSTTVAFVIWFAIVFETYAHSRLLCGPSRSRQALQL
jgi:O-antigen ligase